MGAGGEKKSSKFWAPHPSGPPPFGAAQIVKPLKHQFGPKTGLVKNGLATKWIGQKWIGQNWPGPKYDGQKWTGQKWIGPKRSSPLGRGAQGIRAEPREDDNLCKLLVLVEASRESLGLAIVGFQEGHRMALLPLNVAATNCLCAQPLGSPRCCGACEPDIVRGPSLSANEKNNSQGGVTLLSSISA